MDPATSGRDETRDERAEHRVDRHAPLGVGDQKLVARGGARDVDDLRDGRRGDRPPGGLGAEHEVARLADGVVGEAVVGVAVAVRVARGIGVVRSPLRDLEHGIIVEQPQDTELATWEPSWDRQPLHRPDLTQIGSAPEGYRVEVGRDSARL